MLRDVLRYTEQQKIPVINDDDDDFQKMVTMIVIDRSWKVEFAEAEEDQAIHPDIKETRYPG